MGQTFPLGCDVCGAGFDSAAAMQQHLISAHELDESVAESYVDDALEDARAWDQGAYGRFDSTFDAMSAEDAIQAQSYCRSCEVCGCTDDRACEGGCSWVDDPAGRDVCSQCVERSLGVQRTIQLVGESGWEN